MCWSLSKVSGSEPAGDNNGRSLTWTGEASTKGKDVDSSGLLFSIRFVNKFTSLFLLHRTIAHSTTN